MRRRVPLTFSTILVVCFLTLGAGIPLASAHGSVGGISSKAQPAMSVARPITNGVAYCQHWHVQLRGNLPAIGTCFDRVVPAHASITPYNLQNHPSCGNSDLHIYQDSGTGAVICFAGTGSANLGNWHINPFVTWDNQATSYSAGSWNGRFWAGSNMTGTVQYFSSGSSHGFTCNTICNDDLSSFRIDS